LLSDESLESVFPGTAIVQRSLIGTVNVVRKKQMTAAYFLPVSLYYSQTQVHKSIGWYFISIRFQVLAEALYVSAKILNKGERI